jgi:hypothetical protein
MHRNSAHSKKLTYRIAPHSKNIFNTESPHCIKLCLNYFKNDQSKDSRIKKMITYLNKTYIKNDATFHVEIQITVSLFIPNLFTLTHPNIAVFIKNLLSMQTDS